jgi:hypothetical protein
MGARSYFSGIVAKRQAGLLSAFDLFKRKAVIFLVS